VTIPESEVFRTQFEDAETVIYADAHGIRVSCDAGDLLVVDWYRWLLIQMYSVHQLEPLTGSFQVVAKRALEAFPPVPDDDR
jgi:hypothetical protein